MMAQNDPVAPIEPSGEGGVAKLAIGVAAAVATILGAVYANEGDYVNNRNDPGGPTRFGVTQAVARDAGYRGDMRYFPKHCTGPATVCADDIYLKRYIVGPGYMPIVEAEPAVGGELVDSAVNFGPTRPSSWYQQAMNELGGARLAVDGRIGPASVRAYRSLQVKFGKIPACIATLNRLDKKQKAEYDRLVRVNPRLKEFHRGWVAHRIGNIDRKMCGKGIG